MTAARSRAQAAVDECFDSELADSTIKAYDSVLNAEIGSAENPLGLAFFPLKTEDQFLRLFGNMLAVHGDRLCFGLHS